MVNNRIIWRFKIFTSRGYYYRLLTIHLKTQAQHPFLRIQRMLEPIRFPNLYQ